MMSDARRSKLHVMVARPLRLLRTWLAFYSKEQAGFHHAVSVAVSTNTLKSKGP
jgi:hypothetical protein